jgi:MFS superfamily sulfate permease-like transporter
VTVAAYLVPQVLAYAEVAGLAAVSGLWGAVAALGTYAVLGSSRQLSVGPESTTALMTAITVAPLAVGDPSRYGALAATLALLVGVICLLGRAARLGFLVDMLSRPVLVGYLAGIALIMIAGQLENVTGVPVEGSSSPTSRRSSTASGRSTVRRWRWPPPSSRSSPLSGSCSRACPDRCSRCCWPQAPPPCSRWTGSASG